MVSGTKAKLVAVMEITRACETAALLELCPVALEEVSVVASEDMLFADDISMVIVDESSSVTAEEELADIASSLTDADGAPEEQALSTKRLDVKNAAMRFMNVRGKKNKERSIAYIAVFKKGLRALNAFLIFLFYDKRVCISS